MIGRPTSPRISLKILFDPVVKSRTFSPLSRNRVVNSVPSSRFFMSLFSRERSLTLALNSWLSICSSSFVDCSSSFIDCISSLAHLASS